MDILPIKLDLINISKSFNKTAVLQNINATFYGSNFYAIIGQNGAGKSTLLNIITGNIRMNNGEVRLNDITLESETEWNQLKKLIGFTGQNDFSIDELNPYEYLQLIGLVYSLSKAEIEQRSKSLFDFFNLDDKTLNQKIENLSYGTRKKINFCALFLHNPKLIVLDEPFAGVDKSSVQKLVELLKYSLTKGSIVIMATHTFDNITDLLSSVLLIEDTRSQLLNRKNDATILSKYITSNEVLMNGEIVKELTWIE
jgi:ABC-2 type transport system ATP-binding protein